MAYKELRNIRERGESPYAAAAKRAREAAAQKAKEEAGLAGTIFDILGFAGGAISSAYGVNPEIAKGIAQTGKAATQAGIYEEAGESEEAEKAAWGLPGAAMTAGAGAFRQYEATEAEQDAFKEAQKKRTGKGISAAVGEEITSALGSQIPGGPAYEPRTAAGKVIAGEADVAQTLEAAQMGIPGGAAGELVGKAQTVAEAEKAAREEDYSALIAAILGEQGGAMPDVARAAGVGEKLAKGEETPDYQRIYDYIRGKA